MAGHQPEERGAVLLGFFFGNNSTFDMPPPQVLQELSPVVEGQYKYEEWAGDCGEAEENPEQNVVDLLGKQLPVLQR